MDVAPYRHSLPYFWDQICALELCVWTMNIKVAVRFRYTELQVFFFLCMSDTIVISLYNTFLGRWNKMFCIFLLYIEKHWHGVQFPVMWSRFHDLLRVQWEWQVHFILKNTWWNVIIEIRTITLENSMKNVKRSYKHVSWTFCIYVW